jgi:hypothetical protein
MGNALDAAKFSIEQGNTGVGTKKTLLEGIDRGIQGVQTWKKNIDTQRLKLKTDTAKQYRDAELKTMENLPSDKTSRDLAIKALSNYKDRLYGNMGLVQAGMVKPEDNLIFQENGKQSFDILAQQINGYAKEKENYLKRLKGYYEVDEKGNKKLDNNGNPIFVNPTSGGVDQSLQDLHDRMGNPDFTDMTFGENGMGRITFYKTKIDERTKTRVLDLDADGKPQPYDGVKDMSVLAFNNKRNQTAEKLDLAKETEAVIGKDTPLGQIFEKMDNFGKMLGVVTDDMRNNPQLNILLQDAVATAAATTDRQASILSDNGPESQRSETINEFQAQELKDQGIDLDEKIDYTYIDTDPKSDTYGEELSGKKSKYIQMVMSKNNQIVPVISDDDKLAAERIAGTSFYSGLRRDITDGGTKRSEFQRNAASIKASNDDKEFQSTVDLIDSAAVGNKASLDALVAENKSIVKGYEITGTGANMELMFIDVDGNQMAPISLGGMGIDTGKQIAAQLELKAQRYFEDSKLRGTNKKAGGTAGSYQTVTKEYGGLGAFNIGVSEENGIKRAGTAAETFANAIKGNPEEDEVVGVANTIIQKAVQEYDIDSNIVVRFDDVGGSIYDRYIITVDGVEYASPGQISRKNHAWLEKNMDRVLRGEKPQGTTESTPDVG